VSTVANWNPPFRKLIGDQERDQPSPSLNGRVKAQAEQINICCKL